MKIQKLPNLLGYWWVWDIFQQEWAMIFYISDEIEKFPEGHYVRIRKPESLNKK